MSLSWQRVRDPSASRKMSHLFLLSQESRYVKILDVLSRLDRREIKEFGCWLLWEDGCCRGVVTLSPSGEMLCSVVPLSMVSSLVACVQRAKMDVTRITASKQIAQAFVQEHPQRFELELQQGIYECSKVVLPSSDGGSLVQADMKHKKTVSALVLGFLRDCFPEQANAQRAARIAQRAIAAGNVYLWKNEQGESVSMAAKVGQTENTTSISWVYTPSEHRRCGYGSKVTAYLSSLCMNQERPKCNLFTDATNITSNRMYQRIGYVRIGEQQVYRVTD